MNLGPLLDSCDLSYFSFGQHAESTELRVFASKCCKLSPLLDDPTCSLLAW